MPNNKLINLLPGTEQDAIKKETLHNSLRLFIVASLCTYALVVLAMFGEKFYLQHTLNSVDAEIVKEQQIINKQDNTVLKQKVLYINNTVADYNNLAAAEPRWSKILQDFAALVPADIQMVSISGNTETGKMDINGRSATRDSVLKLRANILASPDFRDIDLPLENLQRPADLNFHYTFYLKEGALKQ